MSRHRNVRGCNYDEGKLYSCMDQMREVPGDTAPESVLTQVALQCAFDSERALDTILSDESTGAPPRSAKTGSARPLATFAEAGSSSSLAQLMSEHVQKSQRAGLPSLSSSTLAVLSGLSLGTLALLNSNSAPIATSPPNHLASSLGSLSLGNRKLTAPGANMAPPSFGSLSSVLQSSRPMEIATGGGAKGADPKGSPSLAELIQEHSNSSPTLYRTLPGLHGNTAQTAAGPAPALTRSLSQLPQPPGPLNTHCSPQTQITTTPEPHVLPLSLLASQRQPVSTLPAADPDGQVVPPPGLLGELSPLASQQHNRTSSDTPPSLSLAALLPPGKPQPRSIREGGVRDKSRPLLSPTPLSPRPPWGDQSVDLSALMAQSSHGGVLFACRHDKGLSSPSAVALRSDHHRHGSSVFARPSVFALTLSVRAPSRGKRRRRRMMMMKEAVGDLRLEVGGGGHPAFLYGTQTQLVKAKEQTPLLPITPFTFDTPSPDDVVRANQKKAFTRE